MLLREKGWLLAASRCRLEHDDLAEWHTRYRMGGQQLAIRCYCCSGFHLHIIRTTNPFMTLIHHIQQQPLQSWPPCLLSCFLSPFLAANKSPDTNYSIDNFLSPLLRLFSSLGSFFKWRNLEIFLDNRPDISGNLCIFLKYFRQFLITIRHAILLGRGDGNWCPTLILFSRDFTSTATVSFSHLLGTTAADAILSRWR